MAAPTTERPLSSSSEVPSMTKSVSYSMTKQERRTSAKEEMPKMSKSKSAEKTNKKGTKKRRKKAQTNKFLTAVNVGQTVRLTKDRIGFIRFKGKVKFGIGIWYGLEIYDSLTTTRHNGTVFGKRYFNCPRNKGLFIRRECIMETIAPQNLKKVLKELEKKQIKQKKLQNKQKKIAAKNMQKKAAKKARENSSILALYQSQVYGNNALQLKLNNDQSNEDEKKIKKDFKRFNRLSFMATTNPLIQSIIKNDNATDFGRNKDDEKKDDEPEDLEDAHKGIDIDSEAWDSLKERQILELLDEDGMNGNDDDGNTFGVRLFYPLKEYIPVYEYIFNKGILIKEVDTIGKKGRALILECGVQGNNGWYIENINDENIKKYSKETVDELLDKLVVNIGYEITLKQE